MFLPPIEIRYPTCDCHKTKILPLVTSNLVCIYCGTSYDLEVIPLGRVTSTDSYVATPEIAQALGIGPHPESEAPVVKDIPSDTPDSPESKISEYGTVANGLVVIVEDAEIPSTTIPSCTPDSPKSEFSPFECGKCGVRVGDDHDMVLCHVCGMELCDGCWRGHLGEECRSRLGEVAVEPS